MYCMYKRWIVRTALLILLYLSISSIVLVSQFLSIRITAVSGFLVLDAPYTLQSLRWLQHRNSLANFNRIYCRYV